jgi:tRNA A-37 threonylcarbamoyl transferase component Bud32
MGLRFGRDGPSLRLFICNLLVLTANVTVIVRLVKAAATADTESIRQRARIVFFPTASWVLLLILVNNLPFYLEGASPVLVEVAASLSVVFPVSLAVAILKTRLFEIDRLITLGTAYVCATAFLAGVFLLSAPALATQASRLFPGSPAAREMAAASLAVVLVLFLNPLRERLQRSIDKLFYRAPQDTYQLLLAALAPAGSTGAPGPKASEISTLVDRVLQPRKQWLWIEDGGGEQPFSSNTADTQRVSSQKAVDADATLAIPGRNLDALRGFLFHLDAAISVFRPSASDEAGARTFREEGFELVIPLRGSDSQVLGFWALGPRRSEEPYSARETEALRALGRALALQAERDRLASQVEYERLGRQRAIGRLARSGKSGFAECPRCGACFDLEGLCDEDGSTTVSIQGAPRLLQGRYRLDRRVGQGGMGAVYRARDLTLRRDVAVKLIHEEHAVQEISRQRFRQEALLAARLKHPNAVAVFDTGEFEGGAYHVMELVEGGSLATELRARGRLPFKEALPYIEGMLSALAAAHEIGLVHRDVKPSNVLLAKGQEGALVAKLADFGLASGIEGENSKSIAGDLTRTGTVLGSPGYMAPEVMAGRPATTESDVWSAAVTAYEILAGDRPFSGASLVEIYESAKAEAFVPLLSLASDIPPKFASILESALAANPRWRYRAAGPFLEALRKALR